MKKVLIALLFVTSFALMGCKVSQSLSIEDSTFATVEESGSLSIIEGNVFNLGDKIAYVLLNVSPFKEGEDGLNWFDVDMLVTNSNDEIVLDKKDMMGEGGHLKLPNNTAEAPYGIFISSEELTPGEYKIKLTIRDIVGEGSASKEASFELQSNEG